LRCRPSFCSRLRPNVAMDKSLEHIILRALEEVQAANLDSIQRDAMAIEVVRRVRPDLSPLDVMVQIKLFRMP